MTVPLPQNELRAALKELRINANRLCDRSQGGTYEEDCRRSIARADAALASQPLSGDAPMQLDKIHEDRDVAEPFFQRLLQRVREKHKGEDIRMEDISITVEVRLLNGPAQIHRMLNDIVREGISI